MKKFILELYPVAQLYKGHASSLEFLSLKLGYFNGGTYAGAPSDFLGQVIRSEEMKGLQLVPHPFEDNRFYLQNVKTTGGYVVYGIVYEVNVV